MISVCCHANESDRSDSTDLEALRYIRIDFRALFTVSAVENEFTVNPLNRKMRCVTFDFCCVSPFGGLCGGHTGNADSRYRLQLFLKKKARIASGHSFNEGLGAIKTAMFVDQNVLERNANKPFGDSSSRLE